MSVQALYSALTGMDSSTDGLQIVANNLANTESAGFKRSDVEFQDVFYEALAAPGTSATSSAALGVEFGFGTQIAATPTDFSQGPISAGLALDAAISGQGFYRVVDGNGDAFYTRYGAFEPKAGGASGLLNLQLGERSVLVDPPIFLPGGEEDVSIAPDGTVFQGETVLGQLQLTTFRNPGGLLQIGELLFEETLSSGPAVAGAPGADGRGILVPGFLEGSNTEIATELVITLEMSRMFNFNAQVFRTGNEEYQEVINLARQT